MHPAKKKKLERLKALQQSKDNGNDFPFNPNSNATIGVYTHRHETGEKFCASDRIRAEWIINHSHRMELLDPSRSYEVVIFHVPTHAIKDHGRIKILDICDKVWERDEKEFLELIQPIDAIVVPTEQLKQALSQITDKDIHVIPDGHDLSHYTSRMPNLHTQPAREVVWFGYAENAKCLEPFINYIKSCGLKLKVICQHQNTSPLEHADVFIKWDINTYIKEISKSDFAILPQNENYKSNNKDITALLCGIPVAKTKQDISRLINAEERRIDMDARKDEPNQYNIKISAAAYMKLIDSLKKEDIIQVYSSICGKFDRPRKDIQVFSDSPSDMFRMPVMNAKIYKILAHKYFSSPYTVYVDGNIFLNVTPSKLMVDYLKGADIALFKHPWRDCLYKEHEHARQRVIPELKPLMDQQIAQYRKEGMPVNFGLGECGMLIRRNNEATAEFNERWWAEICRYTNRDQISFPYIVWKMGNRIKVNYIQGNVRDHSFFKYVNH